MGVLTTVFSATPADPMLTTMVDAEAPPVPRFLVDPLGVPPVPTPVGRSTVVVPIVATDRELARGVQQDVRPGRPGAVYRVVEQRLFVGSLLCARLNTAAETSTGAQTVCQVVPFFWLPPAARSRLASAGAAGAGSPYSFGGVARRHGGSFLSASHCSDGLARLRGSAWAKTDEARGEGTIPA